MILDLHISKEQEGSYFTLPFSLSEEDLKAGELMTVRYCYPREGACVDLGLSGPDGEFLGWSGSARSEVFVSAYDSTEGYLPVKLRAGRWGILVGAYHIPDAGLDVRYEIALSVPEPKLYLGDTHVHTTASDGKLNIAEVAALAKKRGLSFLCLANHNNYSENLSLPHINGMSFIPSVEWTHYKGHMNIYGLKEPFKNSFVANSQEEMDLLLAEARSRGGLVSVNHPDCPFCPYLWADEGNYDMVEIWNGPMTGRNLKAIRRWTALLNSGRHIPATGGSDFHRPRHFARLGHPALGVISRTGSPDDLLAAMRAGRSFVSCGARGPRLLLSAGPNREFSMGDTAPKGAPLFLEKKGCAWLRLRAVTDLGEFTVRGRSFTVPEGARYVYVKGLFLGLPRVITNPVYFGAENT